MLATGPMGWPPARFWRATPLDLALALQGLTPRSPAPLTRTALATLMERFPDR
ncbi:phage tail assembly chaperone [Hankyongella ginsenosidimutans]|uniref:Phage tail assembly chaperone n=2 Tax=Hankyongella ginsenosidimutans TaxID=1763828 RepID=A0A4D7C455_9SPHN|nr:phage tail assembly chaperone [Hankyongella ginsenosidimutans]